MNRDVDSSRPKNDWRNIRRSKKQIALDLQERIDAVPMPDQIRESLTEIFTETDDEV